MTVPADAVHALSKRQAEIADMLAGGMSSREIAATLNVSPRTVESHIAAIFNKFGVRSRAEFLLSVLGPPKNNEALEAPRELSPKTNLPAPRSRLIGRAVELADIVRLLESSRLVTLTGVGGIGKTRLALAVGASVLPATTAGVWLVEFADLAAGTSAAQALAAGMHVEEDACRPLIETLISRLAQHASLVILDNCEHVIELAAEFADTLVARCPHLRVLATSREPLRVSGEFRYRIPPLTVPTVAEARSLKPSQALDYDAVDLFTERARAIDHEFMLRDDNVEIVTRICRQLDGIPLALELAAARIKILSLRTLATKLDSQLHLLTNGERTALPRQKTIHALIDWSYDLLTAPEQRLFEVLAVFVGGCTLAEASFVYGGDHAHETDVLGLLSSLVDKSLVVADLTASESRYGLLQSFRHYAYEKLVSRGEAQSIRARHASAYVELAERLDRAYDDSCDSAWFARACPEIENWRAALNWTLEARHDLRLGQRLTIALRAVWTIGEGWRRWLAIASPCRFRVWRERL